MKTIIITGGTQGLGFQIAKILAKQYKIIILARTQSDINKVTKTLKCGGYCCDISDHKQVEETFKLIMKKYKKINCLINNAGIYIEQELILNPPEKIKEVIETNVLGTIYPTQTVIPLMTKQNSGLIINIISQSGLIGQNGKSVYNSSKWAITGFTKSLQLELQKYNILVTGIYPGKINTNMFKKSGIEKEMSNALHPVEIARLVRFILSFNNLVYFPEIGIKHPQG